MKLYGHPISGNSHRVQALLNILGLEHEFIVVNLPEGAHKAPDFLALNPLGQVPVLVDGDVTLRDSSAIMIYLARKYDTDNRWLPADAAGQAHVQEWLSTAVNDMMQGPAAVRAIALFGSPADVAVAKAKTDALFTALFEPHLKDRDWLVGNTPTIADIACYSYVARVTDGDHTLDAYPATTAWLARVEALDNFAPMVVASEFFAAAKA